jgi:hypothetical protein
MPRQRFEKIKAQFHVHPVQTNYDDPWYPVRDFVEQFNHKRRLFIYPGVYVLVDECMSGWKGNDLPHLSYLPNKPVSVGTELKSIIDVESGVMLALEIQVCFNCSIFIFIFVIAAFPSCTCKCGAKFQWKKRNITMNTGQLQRAHSGLLKLLVS